MPSSNENIAAASNIDDEHPRKDIMMMTTTKAWIWRVLFFIWGLVVSHSILEYVVLCRLMLFLVDWMGISLMVSCIFIIAFDGLSSLLAFLAPYVALAGAYVNSFDLTIFTTAAYAMGLILLWIIAKSWEERNMFYVAIALIAIGKSGRGSTLRSFLHDQLMKKRNENEDAGNVTEKPQIYRDVILDLITSSSRIWWHSAWILGYVISLLAFVYATYDYTWDKHLMILTHLMESCYLVFNSGFFSYEYTHSHKNEDQPPIRLLGIKLIKELKPNSYKELLLWVTFIGYSLVLSTGNTIFVAQTASTSFGEHPVIVSVSIFFVLKSFISDIVVFLFWIVKVKLKDSDTITMVRIGFGMICSVLCCVVAREVELHRLSLIRKEGVQGPTDTISMSVLWLIPQYCLLGLMEGLAGGGFVTYTQSRMSEPWMRSFVSEPFSELVLCVGKFGSIVVMFIFSDMFGEHINNSEMDRYFLVLAIISSAFFCFFLFWSVLMKCGE